MRKEGIPISNEKPHAYLTGDPAGQTRLWRPHTSTPILQNPQFSRRLCPDVEIYEQKKIIYFLNHQLLEALCLAYYPTKRATTNNLELSPFANS